MHGHSVIPGLGKHMYLQKHRIFLCLIHFTRVLTCLWFVPFKVLRWISQFHASHADDNIKIKKTKYPSHLSLLQMSKFFPELF